VQRLPVLSIRGEKILFQPTLIVLTVTAINYTLTG
jgi:hypothetical protein